jgi:hypothetical protein
MISAKQLKCALDGIDEDAPVVVRVVSPAKMEMVPTPPDDPDDLIAVDDVTICPIPGYEKAVELTVFTRQRESASSRR